MAPDTPPVPEQVPDQVLALPARVRLPEAVQTLERLLAETAETVEGPAEQVISLAGLTDSDSSVIAVLLALRRARGSTLVLRDIPERVLSLAGLYGVASLLFPDPVSSRPPLETA
jgi:ABC-type transporter Mla MlaB component